jgi:sarcosine oxidase gamma subunit
VSDQSRRSRVSGWPRHANVLGKAELVLLTPGAPHRYRIECWRSFAPYVQALLAEVAREFETN